MDTINIIPLSEDTIEINFVDYKISEDLEIIMSFNVLWMLKKFIYHENLLVDFDDRLTQYSLTSEQNTELKSFLKKSLIIRIKNNSLIIIVNFLKKNIRKIIGI